MSQKNPARCVPQSDMVTMDTGEQTNLMSTSIVIGDFNRDEFLPGNPVTIGNFPGFQLGVMYRIFIEYFNANGTKLNTGEELSDFSHPLIKASAPLVRHAWLNSLCDHVDIVKRVGRATACCVELATDFFCVGCRRSKHAVR